MCYLCDYVNFLVTGSKLFAISKIDVVDVQQSKK